MKTADDIERALDSAFRVVFGESDETRSKAQRLVLARLRQLARPGKSLYSPKETDRDLAMRSGRLELYAEIEKRAEGEREDVYQILGLKAANHEDDDL